MSTSINDVDKVQIVGSDKTTVWSPGSLSAGAATLLDGTKALTTSGVALSSTSVPCKAVLVQADPNNAVDIKVGNATSQSIVLQPGQVELLPMDDVAKVFAKAVSGTATANWAGVV